MEYYHYYNYGKQATQESILNGVIHSYSLGFSYILSGDIVITFNGALMVVGLTAIISAGLWRLLGKTIFRLTLDKFHY